MTDPAAIDLVQRAKAAAVILRNRPCEVYGGAQLYSDLATAVEALRERVETARLEVEQCHAKSTCCCGDYVKQHTGYEGHTPVAMYDYALDGAVTERDSLKARVAVLLEALAPFCGPGGGPEMQAFCDMDEDDVVWGNSGKHVTVGDVRRAREASGPTSMLHFRPKPNQEPTP